MNYEIDKSEWQPCKLCGDTIQKLNKEYGCSGKYSSENFKQHIEQNHKISIEEYFEKYIKRPICKCNICNKLTNISIKGSKFIWRRYSCGRNDGVKKWSEKAKTERLGKNNPMFGKEPWNSGKNKENCEIYKEISKKKKGIKFSDEHKVKLSNAAKIRSVHGHTGMKHTEDNKELFRKNTLRMIREGKFKQTKTKPHIVFTKILDDIQVLYEEEVIRDMWCFDFYIPNHNLYIEVDGDYFHTNPKIYPYGPKTKTQKINKYRDYQKDLYIIHRNMWLLRFWESDILNNKEDIKCRLRKLLQLED